MTKMANTTPTRRKPNDSITEDKAENELPEALDRGWAWVVVAASFLIHVISWLKINTDFN